MKTLLTETLSTLILAVAIFFGLRTTIQHSVVATASSEPTLEVGQHLIVNKAVYHFREPRRGEIIVFPAPSQPKSELIKRVIGLPGESVEIRDGIVYIHRDSQVLALTEPYITDPARSPFKGSRIPEDKYFVLGDNRNNSADSRTGWLVSRRDITGKAWLSVWPPDRWGLAPNYSFQKN